MVLGGQSEDFGHFCNELLLGFLELGEMFLKGFQLLLHNACFSIADKKVINNKCKTFILDSKCVLAPGRILLPFIPISA